MLRRILIAVAPAAATMLATAALEAGDRVRTSVVPVRNPGFSRYNEQYPVRTYYVRPQSSNYRGYIRQPASRLQYGYGRFPGNYYQDNRGFFAIRRNSHYWYGIHR